MGIHYSRRQQLWQVLDSASATSGPGGSGCCTNSGRGGGWVGTGIRTGGVPGSPQSSSPQPEVITLDPPDEPKHPEDTTTALEEALRQIEETVRLHASGVEADGECVRWQRGHPVAMGASGATWSTCSEAKVCTTKGEDTGPDYAVFCLPLSWTRSCASTLLLLLWSHEATGTASIAAAPLHLLHSPLLLVTAPSQLVAELRINTLAAAVSCCCTTAPPVLTTSCAQSPLLLAAAPSTHPRSLVHSCVSTRLLLLGLCIPLSLP